MKICEWEKRVVVVVQHVLCMGGYIIIAHYVIVDVEISNENRNGWKGLVGVVVIW